MTRSITALFTTGNRLKKVRGLGGIIILILDNVPSSSLPESSPQTLPEAERAKMIVRRRATRKNPVIFSAVFGEPDFLPFSFLSIGSTRGAAVGRLVREFTTESAEYFITQLRKDEVDEEKFTPEELAELFGIDHKKEDFIKAHQNGTKDLKAENFKEFQPIPVATGFLVGRSYLLTNYHIFPEKESEAPEDYSLQEEWIGEYIAQFGYEQDAFGRTIEPIEYRFDKILCFDKQLDYVLVKLEKHPLDSRSKELGEAGDNFGWIKIDANPNVIAPPLNQKSFLSSTPSELVQNLPIEEAEKTDYPPNQISDEVLQRQLENLQNKLDKMQREEGLTIKLVDLETLKQRAKSGEPINIIQHPKGRYKEVILSNNRVLEITQDFVLYEADTDFSSSGSPVLNQQWQLVALHHAALAEESEENDSKTFKIIAQKGIRTCKIVKHMLDKARRLNEKAKEEAISRGEFNPVMQKEPPKDADAEEILKFIEDFVAKYQEETNESLPPKEKPPYVQLS